MTTPRFQPRMTLAQATQAVCAIGIALAALLVILALHGCSSEPQLTRSLCAFQTIGATEEGLPVARIYCQREE